MPNPRVRFEPVDGAAEVFTPEFLDFFVAMHDQFAPRVRELREARAAMLSRALREGTPPGPRPPSAATTGDWQVPPVPEELRKPGIEISGPACLTGMFINALNPGP